MQHKAVLRFAEHLQPHYHGHYRADAADKEHIPIQRDAPHHRAAEARAGAGMGRCQGGFCGPRVLELISRELGIDPLDILQDKNGSNVLVSETKVGGKSNG